MTGAPLLTTASTVRCPHGGSVALTTSNVAAMAGGAPLLLLTDQHAVSGCPFQVPAPSGTKPQPCVLVRWTAGAAQTRVHGTPVLLQTSAGLCYSAEQLPQGPPVVVSTQQQVTGV